MKNYLYFKCNWAAHISWQLQAQGLQDLQGPPSPAGSAGVTYTLESWGRGAGAVTQAYAWRQATLKRRGEGNPNSAIGIS